LDPGEENTAVLDDPRAWRAIVASRQQRAVVTVDGGWPAARAGSIEGHMPVSIVARMRAISVWPVPPPTRISVPPGALFCGERRPVLDSMTS
jgi:hypothetical protein